MKMRRKSGSKASLSVMIKMFWNWTKSEMRFPWGASVRGARDWWRNAVKNFLSFRVHVDNESTRNKGKSHHRGWALRNCLQTQSEMKMKNVKLLKFQPRNSRFDFIAEIIWHSAIGETNLCRRLVRIGRKNILRSMRRGRGWAAFMT